MKTLCFPSKEFKILVNVLNILANFANRQWTPNRHMYNKVKIFILLDFKPSTNS